MNIALLLLVSLLVALLQTTVTSCPTCVGRVENDSPPFFTKEFYNQDDNEDLLDDEHYTNK